MPDQVQEMMFSKTESPSDQNGGNGWTVEAAKTWLRDHDMKSDDGPIDDKPEKEFCYFRQLDAEKCAAGSFKVLTENFPKGVKAQACDVPEETSASRADPRRASLASSLWNRPLLMDSRRLDAIRAAATDPAAFLLLFEDADEPTEDEGGVRTIAVRGTLFPERLSRIEEKIDQALADPKVRGILLDVDSPGGPVRGLFDFADRLFAKRNDEKPIWAVANDDALSAAYAVASAADRLHVTRSGAVGSVGVIAMHVEFSKMDERMGVTFTPITSGERKKDGIDTEPLQPEARRILQGEVDRLRELFVETVARHRGLDAKAVWETEASIYFGPQGTEIGFADAVASRAETHQQLRAELDRRGASAPAGGPAPEKEEETMELPTTIETALGNLPENVREAARAKVTKQLEAIDPLLEKSLEGADAETRAAIDGVRADAVTPILDADRARAESEGPPDPAADPSLPESTRAEIRQLREKQAESERQVREMKAAQRRRDLDAHVRESLSALPGDRDAVVSLLERADDAGFRTDLEQVLSAASEAIANGKLLEERGGAGASAGGDALKKIEARAAELRKQDSALTPEAAATRAMEENPSLYAEYVREAQAS